jgi:dTDP-4-dehydrorhamnose reductase
MKIVLIGKNGQLGWEFQQILPAFGEMVALGREELDISDQHAVQHTLLELKPNLIINASAYTEVDLAETQTELAEKINAISPGIMAETARKTGAVFIHYSTDYVFDGNARQPYTENDATNPLNEYGRSKLLGEKNIQESGDAYLIFRTSWVYSLRGNSFVNKVLGWSRKNKVLRIVSDQVGSPTWAQMLAETTCKAVFNTTIDFFNTLRTRHGIYHLTGAGYTSRYEWAKQILANDPKRTEQLVQTIEPVSSLEFPTPAARPLFSVLNCGKFTQTFGLRPPNWEESLQAAMSEK